MRIPIILLVVAVAGGNWACADANNATRARNIRVVELQHEELWSKGNVDRIQTDYSVDFIGHYPAGIVRGATGLRARVEAHRAAFPDWTETVDDVIADGDRVVTRITSRGTNLGEFLGKPPTGRRVEISEVCIFRLQGEKIVEMWVYPDFRSLQRQLSSDEP
jgi:steroid delta-isomerase-like uncharacterized protein